MKLLRIIALLILLPMLAMAQDMQDVEVKEGTMKMGKKKMPCFYVELPYEKPQTVAAIEDVFDRNNIKRSKRKKGVSVYKGVQWAQLSATKCDYYWQAKNRKGKTRVYFCASKGYDNYVTRTNDPATSHNVANFLKKLNGIVFNTIQVQKQETELKALKAQNEQAEKDLKDAKKAEAEKAKQIQQLKRDDAPNPTK